MIYKNYFNAIDNLKWILLSFELGSYNASNLSNT